MNIRRTARRTKSIALVVSFLMLLVVMLACRLPQFSFPQKTTIPTSIQPKPTATQPPVAIVSPDHDPAIFIPTSDPATVNPSTEPIPTMKVTKDVPYRVIASVDPILVSLDIYAPASGQGYPVLVMIHGGAWRGGQKDSSSVAEAKSLFFTSKNYIFVSINYRLAPEYIHPAQVEDTAAALAWIYQNIAFYGGDPSSIFVMGHSSGGQLAALVATDERYLAVYGMGTDMIRGVILLEAAGLDIPATINPEYNFMYTTAFGSDPRFWADASPINHISSGKSIPPFLVCTAGQVSAWISSGRQFAIALNHAGIPVRLVLANEKTHNSITEEIGMPGDPVTTMILAFMRVNMPFSRSSQPAWR